MTITIRQIFAVLLFSSGLAAAGPAVTVQVGAGGLVFSPSTVTASTGTVVNFVSAGLHSVTQSSFGSPCTHNGFNSAPLASGETFSIVITDDSHPIWFYCNVGSHCGSGMVGAINAPASGNTFDAFHAAALALGESEPPQPDAGVVVNDGIGATAVPAGSTPTLSGGTVSATDPVSGTSSAPTSNTPATTSAPVTVAVSSTAEASRAASATSAAPSSSSTTQSDATRTSFNAGTALLLGALAMVAAFT